MANLKKLQDTATQIRRDVLRMVNMAGSGHPGGSLSSADIVTALYFSVMKHNPATWTRESKGQDVFVLSAGHLAPLYYATLARAGYFPVKELGTLRKFESRLQGHPSIEKNLPGVIKPSGSLGQGLSVACGFALAKKLSGEKTKVYCLLGDGESEEGQIWEAGMFAANHKINNLIAITDWNCCQIDGNVNEVAGLGDLAAKWKAFGWEVIVVENGNDIQSILDAFEAAGKSADKPVMLLMKTEMGHGVDFMAGKHGWHGKAPNDEETATALSQLKETLGDF